MTLATTSLPGAKSLSATAASDMSGVDLERVTWRVRNEYLEMPGLSLTPSQAQRLWQLARTDCEALLVSLVQCGFLARTATGSFVRAGSGRSGA